MTPAALFTTLFTLLLCAFSSLAAPAPARAPPPLPSFLKKGGSFFRAVTGAELALVPTVYRKGLPPASHATLAGDFSSTGALYVFNDINEAHKWGDSLTLLQDNHYVLVEFTYTPNTHLVAKSFATGTPEWTAFVNGNYAPHAPATGFDIVEGPVSVGRARTLQPFVDAANGGQMLWQGAFISTAAMHTLTVKNVVTVPVAKKGASSARFCPTCNIQ
ncbi:hypothetical protein EVG20_g9446 [Dentipellis fragilis]|uniref:Uncharacterized protein n=1 Tax=Dentipellis fragilis TaxID=205917 RepID=A0A4Y9XZ65_9AGAM|nr:hypothetical protein EVG20_g9446 [Dentipellis fragilis]